MGTISVNKLGGLAFIVGPILAVVCYFLQPGGALIDAADPADTVASITAITSNSGLSQLTGMVIPVALIVFLFGVFSLRKNIDSGGNGQALALAGGVMLQIGVIGWVIGSGLTLAVAGMDLATQAVPAGTLYGASSGIGTIAGVVAGLGFLLLGLGVSTRDEHNRIAALVAAIAGAVTVVTGIVGGLDSTQLELMTQITGICFIVLTVWGVITGLNLLKQD